MREPRSRLPTEARQSEIIAAVLELAARGSPAGITTADIARELKLSQGAVFKHFPTKEAIWLAALDWVEAHLLSSLESAAQAAATPMEGIGAMFRAHVKFIMSYPGVPRLIFQDLQQPDDTPLKARVRGLLGRYRKLLIGLFDEAERQGQIAQDLDKVSASMLFVGAIQGLAIHAMLNGSTNRMAGEAERVLALYLQAIQGQS